MNNAVRYLVLCLTVAMYFASDNCSAQGLADQSDDSLRQQLENERYEYKAEGRSDPFKPFVTPKSTSSALPDPNEIVEEKTEYSGMQLFEPGQLALVGIMMTSSEPIAMVEDQTKKGYMLKIGELVGKRGVVTSIDEHQVVITETARTRSGQEMKSTVIMKMKHEGDK